ncbi:MAG TPA: allantoinase AllB [Streptosporangiaceae bacterium]|nr:allantoinase AllB [Streptosporangiaceae bacterium]
MPDPASGRPELLLRARQAVTPDGHVSVLIAVTRGKISAVLPYDTDAAASYPGVPVVQLAGDEVLLPGLVDSHVHVNEPGRTQWEGFATATAAAAAGGITTIVDMPLNSIPAVTDAAALAVKRAAAAGQCQVDVAFWGGAVPGNDAARPGLHAAGVRGFKCFLVDSGVPEFPPLDSQALALAAHQVAGLRSLLLVHAEDAACIAVPGGPDYAAFLASRPPAAETAAIRRVIDVARDTGVRAHILHLSAADALPLLAAARAEGLPVTAETCPHYLALAAEEVPAGATTYKCCPPIRDRANRDLLWEGLRAGIIDCVVSDHSPCPPALKQLPAGDFGLAWGGIASLQLALPVVWTSGRERGFGLADLARWMAAAPAEIAGLPAKGAIAVGRDADLVAFAPDEEFVVEPGLLRHRHKLTPYLGRRLSGVVRRTWLRGRPVFGAQAQPAERPAGELL